MSDVSRISSASSRMRSCAPAQSRMPSLADRPGASGCGRRVSLNRRTSVALLASRKISIGFNRCIIEPLEDLGEGRQEVRARGRRRRSRPSRVVAADRERRQCRDQRRRQVVDAEVAEILEGPHRLRFSGARESGEDDERRSRPLTAFVRAVPSALHRSPPSSSSSVVVEADRAPLATCGATALRAAR